MIGKGIEGGEGALVGAGGGGKPPLLPRHPSPRIRNDNNNSNNNNSGVSCERSDDAVVGDNSGGTKNTTEKTKNTKTMMKNEKNSVLSDLIDDRAWDDVLRRLRSHPLEASERVDRGGWTGGNDDDDYDDDNDNDNGAEGGHRRRHHHLPLHEACRLNPPARIVSALIEAYPESISTRGMWSFLPLHFAVKSDSAHAVSILMGSYPDAARRLCDGGRLPLHLACLRGNVRPDVVNALLVEYPEAVYVRDDDGFVPVDHVDEGYDDDDDSCYRRRDDDGDYDGCGGGDAALARTLLLDVLECGPAYCAVAEAGKKKGG